MWKDVGVSSLYSPLFTMEAHHTVRTLRHEGKTHNSQRGVCIILLHILLLPYVRIMYICVSTRVSDFVCICTCTHSDFCTRVQLCVVYVFEKDDRWWEGSRSFETCHSVPVYEPLTGDTHPSTSKFITVHHLPTCSVMTFSQSYKNPWKPVGINQCLSTFPAAAHIHY